MAVLKNKKEINIEKVNEMVKTGNKILKILYAFIIVGVIYACTLILKEWKVFSILFNILRVISPLFIGFILAWLLNPVVKELEKRGMRRSFAVVVVYLVLILLLYLICLALVPVLTQQINDIVSSIPGIISEIGDWINNLFNNLSDKTLVNLNDTKKQLFESLETFGKNLTTNLPATMFNVVSSFVSGLGNILLGFVVGFYLLFNFDNVSKNINKLLPKKIRKDTSKIIGEISQLLYKYCNGTLLITAILFVVSIIGFSIIGLNSPVLFALFCAITNLIPYVGPYVGGAPAVLVGFSQSSIIGILTLVFIIICQLLESNFLHPIVIGKKMDLHPVTIVVSLLIFGYYFGIIGMIVATPVVAVLKVLYIYFDNKYDFFGYTNK